MRSAEGRQLSAEAMAAEAQRLFVDAVANSRTTLSIDEVGITVRPDAMGSGH